jgi:fermentation-respiration switch protein FrsA (DUF1100 family)
MAARRCPRRKTANAVLRRAFPAGTIGRQKDRKFMFGEIKNSLGERLDYTYHAGQSGSQDIAVLGHGVTGNKDRPFLVALAEGLGRAGIPALRFSFSGNGASGGQFADSTITKEVADLGAVLDALKGRRICYAGHSMGGAVGVLRASRDERIRFLISLAGMVNTKAFAEREFGNVKPGEGFMWDEPSCPLSRAYMDDMARIGSVAELASKIKVPWLLVHGTEDDVVPISDSQDIFSKASEPKQLIEIKGANHVFGGEFTPVLVDKVVKWLQGQFA